MTQPSSLPETKRMGSLWQKSTLQMRFSCASYSRTLWLVFTSHSASTPAQRRMERFGYRFGAACFTASVSMLTRWREVRPTPLGIRVY